MIPSRRISALIACGLVLALFALGDVSNQADSPGLFAPAEARLGRPATPVSVAGAGRRTVRRCAAGVYNC